MVLTLAELVELLAALIGATPKIIQIVQTMQARGAAHDAQLSPEDHATVLDALKSMAREMPQGTGNVMVDAMQSV